MLCKRIFEDDKENDRVMEEASLINFGKMLIDCFVTLLLFSTPAQPGEFYNRHQENMIGEFLRAENYNFDKAEEKVLLCISSRLEYENKSREFFGLPRFRLKRVCQL